MEITAECDGMKIHSCYIFMDGRIDSGAPERFTAIADSPEVAEFYKVMLNSDGGDLEAGLQLGRAIRERGLTTEVGSSNWSGNEKCWSACAYAFVGGVNRRAPSGQAQLGFHQVSLRGGGALPGQAGLTSGQIISAFIIGYLAEMGIDPGIFIRAANTPSNQFYYPTAEELVDYRIVTATGFTHFFLEPYGDGVVAASKRLNNTRPNDSILQVTAFCRHGVPSFLLTLDFSLDDSIGPAFGASISVQEHDGKEVWADEISIRNDGLRSFVTLTFPTQLKLKIRNAENLHVTLDLVESEGGYNGADFSLTEMDRSMLNAAFRFCIGGER